MKTKLFYKQMTRSVKTVAVNVVILAVVTAFFCMSLNLYSSSMHNLQMADDTYRTVAIMELYGDVDQWGDLTTPESEGYQGYRAVGVTGYDLEDIVNAAGVLDYDLRQRYAAYIVGQPAMEHDAYNTGADNILMVAEDVIRFTLEGDEPVKIPINWSEGYDDFRHELQGLYLTILDSAAGCFWYQKSDFDNDGIFGGTEEEREFYADRIRQLNRSDELDYVTLYPGVEYISSTWLTSGWQVTEKSNGLLTGHRRFYAGTMAYFDEDFRLCYGKKREFTDSTSGIGTTQPFPIARWEDVQNDPELKAQWDEVWEAMKYNVCSYNVCLTDDITGVPVMHVGGAYLSDGRMITREEYESGAKVCMVSKEMAQLQKWRVGTKLDMNLFRFASFPNSNDSGWYSHPVYHKGTEGFFDSGEYEIVGIFDQKKLTGTSGIAQSTLAMPWNLIYLPKNSVQNTLPQEELLVHGALLTIWLENGAVNDFLADMDRLGLGEKTEGQYHPTFTFYDQGYSIIQPGLQSMHGTARLLLILSSLLLLITCVLLAWFFAQRQKHNIGIFRMLGGEKHRAVAAVLVCALAVALLGAAPGAALGHSLSERVGETLLAGDLEESHRSAALRANVLANEDGEGMELSVQAQAGQSLLAACGAILFPLLTLLFVVGYIGKEPRALLPQNRD